MNTLNKSFLKCPRNFFIHKILSILSLADYKWHAFYHWRWSSQVVVESHENHQIELTNKNFQIHGDLLKNIRLSLQFDHCSYCLSLHVVVLLFPCRSSDISGFIFTFGLDCAVLKFLILFDETVHNLWGDTRTDILKFLCTRGLIGTKEWTTPIALQNAFWLLRGLFIRTELAAAKVKEFTVRKNEH